MKHLSLPIKDRHPLITELEEGRELRITGPDFNLIVYCYTKDLCASEFLCVYYLPNSTGEMTVAVVESFCLNHRTDSTLYESTQPKRFQETKLYRIFLGVIPQLTRRLTVLNYYAIESDKLEISEHTFKTKQLAILFYNHQVQSYDPRLDEWIGELPDIDIFAEQFYTDYANIGIARFLLNNIIPMVSHLGQYYVDSIKEYKETLIKPARHS